MNFKVVLFVTLFVLALGGAAAAQNVADPGIPDTIRFEPSDVPLGTTNFTVPVTLYNDEDLAAFQLTMIWDSDDIICYSVSYVGTRVEYVATKPFEIGRAHV